MQTSHFSHLAFSDPTLIFLDFLTFNSYKADVLKHSSRVPAGTCDIPLRTSAWQAKLQPSFECKMLSIILKISLSFPLSTLSIRPSFHLLLPVHFVCNTAELNIAGLNCSVIPYLFFFVLLFNKYNFLLQSRKWAKLIHEAFPDHSDKSSRLRIQE